jgi:histidine triad (HIT) family protein
LGEQSCFVCDKHRGLVEIPGGCLYEDELVYASHGAMPEGESEAYLGTLFVEPKRHAAGLEDLTDLEAQRLGLVVTRLSRALRAATQAERIYSAVLGHHVPHLHLWLIARYSDTPREFWGVRVLEWPQAPRGDAHAVGELCSKVRDQLHLEDL